MAVVNDIRNVTAFIDFKKFGEVEYVDICQTKEQKDKISNNDGIGIFLNFDKILFTKTKLNAINELNRLINECPNEAKKDFEKYKEILFRSLK